MLLTGRRYKPENTDFTNNQQFTLPSAWMLFSLLADGSTLLYEWLCYTETKNKRTILANHALVFYISNPIKI